MEATLTPPVDHPSPGLRSAGAAVAALVCIGATIYGARLADIDVARGAQLLTVLVWAIAGVAVTRKASGPMGFVMLSLAASGAAWIAVSDRPSTIVRSVAFGVAAGVVSHLMLVLPDGALRTSKRRATAIAGYVIGAATGVESGLRAPGQVTWPLVLALLLALVTGGIGSTIRYRKSRGLERQRLQWFGWAVTVGATIAALAGAMRLLVSWPTDAVGVAVVAALPIPIALMFASNQRFVSKIDRLLATTVSVGGLTGVVAATYLLIVLGLGRVPTPSERVLLLLSMAGAIIAALLYLPTRERLTIFANRLVYGELHAPDEVLRTFGSRMTRSVTMDELLLQMAESLRKTFALDMVEVWTGSTGNYQRTVSEPDRGTRSLTVKGEALPVVARAGVSGNAWLKIWLPDLLVGREESLVRVTPVAHQGELLGLITLERRQSDEPFTEENDRVLTELARQVGLALHNAQLDNALQATLDEVRKTNAELQASRARIVAAGDKERRKLERNIHDGAQQQLVALKVKLSLVKALQTSNPESAQEILGQLSGDIDETVQSVRDLAQGVYPKMLELHGLVAALNGAATKATIPTGVEVEGEIGRHDQDLEAAIYFCCLEALQNASKHAGEGAQAMVRVRETAEAIEFSVADDGAGFDMSGEGLGMGFVNMADRVGAIGGSIKVKSAPGEGTSITGRIPLAH